MISAHKTLASEWLDSSGQRFLHQFLRARTSPVHNDSSFEMEAIKI
jgi:hypothetical protein